MRFRRTRGDADKAAYTASISKKHEVLNNKKQQYWSERVAMSAGNSTLLWRSMMKILQQDKRPAENLTPTLHDADDFRHFFDKKVKQVCVNTENSPPPASTSTATVLLTQLVPHTEDEVRRLIAL